jgi:hypothetical protein
MPDPRFLNESEAPQGPCAVRCSVCNRALGGRPVPGGLRVSKHRNFHTGQTCAGVALVDHQPIPVRPRSS